MENLHALQSLITYTEQKVHVQIYIKYNIQFPHTFTRQGKDYTRIILLFPHSGNIGLYFPDVLSASSHDQLTLSGIAIGD